MGAYLIGVHVKAKDADDVRQATASVFQSAGFSPVCDDPLAAVVEDEGQLPEDGDGYGVIVSGQSSAGWVSVYVADWPDSGALAKGLSLGLGAPILELWVAEDTHWGYTFYEKGDVADRFADDPRTVAATPAEEQQYRGSAEALRDIFQVPVAEGGAVLEQAREAAGQFAARPVDALAQAVGLPFGHAFMGYDDFLDGDPEDYVDDLEDWPQFRHLLFRPPPGRDGLAE